MGCLNSRDSEDIFIQQKELALQIILCTVADIKSGFFYLDEGDYITRYKISVGFEGMHNALSASLVKQESVIKILEKFILPFKESNNKYLFNDLLIALFVNSRSTTEQKATGIAELLFRDKEELNQDDLILLFQKLFKSVLSYSFAVVDKFGQEQKDFDKSKTKEEEDNIVETEQTLLLLTGQNLAKAIGEAMVEKNKTITIPEFAEKCKTYIPDRFYRDIFIPKLLRISVNRDYENLDSVDKVQDELNKKKSKGKKENENQEQKDIEEQQESQEKKENEKENQNKNEEEQNNQNKEEEKVNQDQKINEEKKDPEEKKQENIQAEEKNIENNQLNQQDSNKLNNDEEIIQKEQNQQEDNQNENDNKVK